MREKKIKEERVAPNRWMGAYVGGPTQARAIACEVKCGTGIAA
jgi:hypothetical protein